MKNFNDLRIGELLLYLQEVVKANVAQIKEHNKLAQASLEKGSAGIAEVNELFGKNIQLTAENNNMLQLHNSLLKFFKDHRTAMNVQWGPMQTNDVEQYHTSDNDDVDMEDEDYVLEQTLNGMLPLDEYHPFAKDESFLQKVLAHYIENEQYEDCSNVQLLLKTASVDVEQ